MKTRKLLTTLLCILLVLSLTACGSSKAEGAPGAAKDNYYAETMGPAQAPEYGLTDSSSTAGSSLPTDRKMIRTIYMEAETEDLTALTDLLTARIAELGGYVEAKELHNGSSYSGYVRRYLTMTVRIPAEKADDFTAKVSDNANVVSSSESVDDVTLQYVDTESHVKALETEQERLLSLLEKADNLKDILTLEERLTSVRYQLERYASQLRTLQNQVSYATIRLNVTEVKEYTPVVTEEPTAWERISQGFANSLKNIGQGLTEFFIWLAVNSPYLLIWAALAGIVLIIVVKRKGWRIRRRRAPKNPENTPE